MAALIQELHNSRTFEVNVTGGSATWRYVVTGVSDEAAAYDLVLATSPGVWYGYTRDKIDMTDRPGLSFWFPVVTYSLPVYQPGAPLPTGGAGTDTPPASSPSSTEPAAGDLVVGASFSIGLEQQHITTALKTIDSGAVAPFTAPDYKNLIGVQADKVEGVDIGIPVATITLKRTLPAMTAGYFKNLLYMCGKTNEDPWWFFKEEEGLFVGASGQNKGTNEFEINFEFKYQKTRIGLDIRGDGTLVCPEKRGWHYLWTSNFKTKDTVANVITERPRAYFVNQVYDKISFTWLGI